jgi:hypothetical protein
MKKDMSVSWYVVHSVERSPAVYTYVKNLALFRAGDNESLVDEP